MHRLKLDKASSLDKNSSLKKSINNEASQNLKVNQFLSTIKANKTKNFTSKNSRM